MTYDGTRDAPRPASQPPVPALTGPHAKVSAPGSPRTGVGAGCPPDQQRPRGYKGRHRNR